MQTSTTIKNEGMSSLGQSLRQRIIYQNINKNTRKVMKLENDTERSWIDDIQDIIMDIAGYVVFIIAGTALIAFVSAMAH